MKDALERTYEACGPYERALLLALHDVVAGRAPGQMAEEARAHRRNWRDVEAQAIEDALVLGRFGVEFSERRLRQLLEFLSRPNTPFAYQPGPKIRPEDARIRVALVVDAPWFKQPQTMPLELGMPELLRAFAPRPTEHDMDIAYGTEPAAYEMRRKLEALNAERQKYLQVVVAALTKGMKQWLEAQDPVKGTLPENILP